MSAQPMDTRTEAALEELKGLIRARFPEAQFRIGASPDDPAIVELIVTVDDDPSQLLDLVVDRQMDLQIDEGLPIFVVTEPSPARVAEVFKAARATRSAWVPRP